MFNTISLCLLSLPTEILVEACHIAACQRTCRQLNDTVVHSHLLRYLIRLGRSGLYDPLLSGHTIPHRVEALEKWEAAWRKFDAKSSGHIRRIVACQSETRNIPAYEIRDDFLIAMPGLRPALGPLLYSYVDLRASRLEGEADPWTKITNDDGGHYKKYLLAFSVKQDLVLLGTRWTYEAPMVELHGISFSRGTPHPLVIGAPIWTGLVFTEEGLQAVVVDDHAILHSIALGESSQLYLYSWKDGHVFQLCEPREPAWAPRFTMISDDTIALIDIHGVGLELCRIVTDPASCIPCLCTLIRLGLPPLASNVRISRAYCMLKNAPAYPHTPYCAIEGRPPRRLPFLDSPKDGITIFDILVASRTSNDFDTLTIVTHLRTLLALATTTPPPLTFIPWKDWGPPVTACFGAGYSIYDRGHDLVVGERWVTTMLDSLRLRDFNSTRIQDSIRGTSDSLRRGARRKVVNQRRVLPRGLFKEGVASELPYMMVDGPAPWSSIPTVQDSKIPALYEERAACIFPRVTEAEDGKKYVEIYST